jgi:hypothetical protein
MMLSTVSLPPSTDSGASHVEDDKDVTALQRHCDTQMQRMHFADEAMYPLGGTGGFLRRAAL